MKVGILTFIHTNNFGANLQCFALQETLKKLGFEAEVINLYRPIDKGYISCSEDRRRFPKLYEYKSLKDYRSKINKTIVKIMGRIKMLFKKNDDAHIRSSSFTSFHAQYIKFSSHEFRNFSQLYNDFNQDYYSHLIVGSDQVWNYASGFSKEPFFLTFASKAKKISYAASVGHDKIPQIVAQMYTEWLKSFTAVSVREDTAVAAISGLVDKEVKQVLDPTLLLSKQDWLQLLSIDTRHNSGDVLVYMLSVSTPALNLAQAVAERLDCKVKVITSRPYYKQLKNVEFLRSENPKSFIELYSTAKFIVTNSFHGTAFAINFNIPFVTVSKKGARLNSRKSSLFKLLKLQDREFFEGNSYNVDSILNCDFEITNAILLKERQESIKFICESLK